MSHRSIKGVLAKYRQGVTAVEAPDDDGSWKIRTTKQEIEAGCIEENIRRFTQAYNTPPLQPQQIELLG
jgi:hypothetical protein